MFLVHNTLRTTKSFSGKINNKRCVRIMKITLTVEVESEGRCRQKF